MNAAVISTYRCNARCQMCNIWQNPTRVGEEFAPSLLEKLPSGIDRVNITGGEPTLRADLPEIVQILAQKTRRLEISTNGSFTDRLVEIGRRFPGITIRASVEGLPKKNDELRGIKDGFDHALRSVLRLKEIGVRDIGFAMVISDQNAPDLLDVYGLASGLGVEFSTSTLHNSFYFHKDDNAIGDLELAVGQTRRYMEALLRSRRADPRLRVKDWFRAYICLGLVRHMWGEKPPLSCTAGTDSFFVDPWGRILVCNGSAEPWIMGDLNTQSFEEIWHSPAADDLRRRVASCSRGCWMMGTAVPALMRNRAAAIAWVFRSKMRLTLRGSLYPHE